MAMATQSGSIAVEVFDSVDLSDVIDKHARHRAPTHPGDVLREEFLAPLEMSANGLARELRIPANRVTKILNRERSVSADTALRLARYFGGSAQFWLNLQSRFDLRMAERELATELARIQRRGAA